MGCSSSKSVSEGDKKPKEDVTEVKESHKAEDKQTPDGRCHAKRYLMSRVVVIPKEGRAPTFQKKKKKKKKKKMPKKT